jgi:hypothetical protein
MSHEKPKMEWAVLGVATVILIFSVIVNYFNPDRDVKAAYYLFATIASLVFGATIINKFK